MEGLGPCGQWMQFVELGIISLLGLVSGVTTYSARRAAKADEQRAQIMEELDLLYRRELRRSGPVTEERRTKR